MKLITEDRLLIIRIWNAAINRRTESTLLSKDGFCLFLSMTKHHIPLLLNLLCFVFSLSPSTLFVSHLVYTRVSKETIDRLDDWIKITNSLYTVAYQVCTLSGGKPCRYKTSLHFGLISEFRKIGIRSKIFRKST